jgi:hypothetical protein
LKIPRLAAGSRWNALELPGKISGVYRGEAGEILEFLRIPKNPEEWYSAERAGFEPAEGY